MLEIEEDIKPFVNDFKLNLFDYHDYENFNMFKTENRLLFEMLTCEKDKEKMKEVLRKHTSDGQVDEESAKAILGILNINLDLEKIKKIDKAGKVEYDMCQAFEDYKKEGREEGVRYAVEKIMKKMQISFYEAAELLELSKTEKNKLQTLIK